jgi:hypothetical protein
VGDSSAELVVVFFATNALKGTTGDPAGAAAPRRIRRRREWRGLHGRGIADCRG